MTFNTFKRSAITAAVAAFGLLGIGAAGATPIASQFFPGKLNQLSDNNAEYLINAGGSLSDAGDSKLDVGDRLVGSFQIETIENLTSGGTNNILGSGRELTGLFDITVTAKAYNVLTEQYTFLFAATGSSGIFGAGYDDIAIRLFDDGSPDYARIDSGAGLRQERLDALMGLAGDGLAFADLGINKYWVANTTTDDILVIAALPPAQAVNTFLVSLNIVNNFSGLDFGLVDCGAATAGLLAFHQTDVCGSGSLLGTAGASTPFDSFSNVDFSVYVNRVPEPGSLALVGLALAGLGAAGKRRKSA